ncbi:iron complex outermembrane recepter protein [Pseudoxanthomonas sp. GM95]|uniref:TonB-dependent siderophore receptor n=1 Tax=Pseudoxanthomonas sp. GM95 TaxID=1881043 RepID=UPI0008B238FF|nr:TonB-dependent receptor [Pseudoxanthomonas sp. GM95]SEL49249.1 iron complex outermembrane recepter protein [Pseudoxanthomonas sp. GM95]
MSLNATFPGAHAAARRSLLHRGLLAAAILTSFHAYADDAETDGKKKATELDGVTVTGVAIENGTGALGDRSVHDTPYAISVVGKEDIEKRQVNSLGDVFFNDPSVVTQVNSYASGWSSPIINRGLGLSYDSYRVNGLQVSSWGGEWPLEVMEEVQLLKGPGGFLYGFGAPGGIANYITKKPTDETTLSVSAGWRTSGIASGQVDAGGRFGADDMFGYRLNVFREKGETYNGGEVDRKAVSLSLDARLSDAMTWTADLIHQSRDLSDEAPAFYFSGITQLPRAISGKADLSVDGSYYNIDQNLLSTGLAWKINDDWTANLSYGVTRHANDVNKIFSYFQNAQGDYTVNSYELGGRSESRQGQALLQGKFATGWLQHQLVAGASWQRDLGWDRSYNYNPITDANGDAVILNLYQPQRVSHDSTASKEVTRGAATFQKAVFVSDTIQFAPGWSLLAGWRYNDYEQVGSYHTYPVTPTYALLFNPIDHVTLYASYIESLEAGGTVGTDYINAGQVLDPTISKQYEVGAKLDFAGWNANAAAFRLEQGASIDQYTDAGKYLVQDGITRYDGVEVSSDVQLTAGLRVGGGVTWLDTAYDKLSPDNAANKGNRVAGASRLSGVVHADYDVAAIDGLSLYAGARYYGDIWYDAANTLKMPGYTLVNAGAGYRMALNGHVATWRLSIENLTDKAYWSNAGLGVPRTYAVSVKFDL